VVTCGAPLSCIKPSTKNKHRGLVGDSDDNLKWPEKACESESVSGTEWSIVVCDGGSMENAEKTIALLRVWGKVKNAERLFAGFCAICFVSELRTHGFDSCDILQPLGFSPLQGRAHFVPQIWPRY
jgi:hypothetical protein